MSGVCNSFEITASDPYDIEALTRCIELSREATRQGENPFACLICRDKQIVAAAITRARRDADITRHAEMIAISETQKKLKTKDLSDRAIYANVEPCAMCSFCIRETGIGRVVYSIPSPIMGGYSKWNILGDSDISNTLPEIFREPPEVIGGLMEAEAEMVWREWHPVDWAVLRYRHARHQTTKSALKTRLARGRNGLGMACFRAFMPRPAPASAGFCPTIDRGPDGLGDREIYLPAVENARCSMYHVADAPRGMRYGSLTSGLLQTMVQSSERYLSMSWRSAPRGPRKQLAQLLQRLSAPAIPWRIPEQIGKIESQRHLPFPKIIERQDDIAIMG
jgi:tRNA(adenine34) deaminase